MNIRSYRQLLVLLPALLLPGAVHAIDYYCMMEPHRLVEVKSAVKGRIESINVERSDFVTSGQQHAYPTSPRWSVRSILI